MQRICWFVFNCKNVAEWNYVVRSVSMMQLRGVILLPLTKRALLPNKFIDYREEGSDGSLDIAITLAWWHPQPRAHQLLLLDPSFFGWHLETQPSWLNPRQIGGEKSTLVWWWRIGKTRHRFITIQSYNYNKIFLNLP